MNNSELHAALSAILSPAEILNDADELLIDQRGRYTGCADMIVQPHSVGKVQELMRFCFDNHIAVTPQGGNTGLCGAAVPNGGILLNLSKLNRIREINLADQAITVDAGCILQNVQSAAKKTDSNHAKHDRISESLVDKIEYTVELSKMILMS